MTTFGVHIGLQETTTSEVLDLYRKIDRLGYGWISVWDHFYSANLLTADCFEAVAMHAALAMVTSRVRIGSLVYSIGYRHPAVIAKAITTIDHLSNGRVDVGLGAGWHEPEYNAYGIDFPSLTTRFEQVDEGLQELKGLLHSEVTSFEGKHFSLVEARNDPRPVQAKIPIWIGGGGEKKTLRLAARHCDGWNVPFVSPETFAHKVEVLRGHCDDVGRDFNEVRCTVNLGIAFTEESLQMQFGKIADRVRPGVLIGSDQQMIDRIGEYEAAGASQINLALRAPFEPETLDRFADLLRLDSVAT